MIEAKCDDCSITTTICINIELLSTKKDMLKKERKLMEDKNKFFEEIQLLKNTLIDHRDKAAHVEKVKSDDADAEFWRGRWRILMTIFFFILRLLKSE